MTARGRFITLEGGEGAGKSTLAKTLADRLQARGQSVLVTREPGGTANAEAIRTLLVDGAEDRWSPMAETLLLYAARDDHVTRLIEPALTRGDWVICDRFSDSTRAYQGAAGGVAPDQIDQIHDAALHGYQPDLTLVVDLDPAVGLARAEARGEGPTRFERQPSQFHAALRQAFLDIAAREPDRCAVIDGSQSPEAVAMSAMAVIEARLAVPS